MVEAERACSRCGARYGGDVIFCPKDGTPLGSQKGEPSADPYLGIELGGCYRLERLIGIGAMASVYRAREVGAGQDVAVKILHRELLENPTVVARFVREARVASRLTHPNVVRMHGTGEVPPLAPGIGGEAYLVMEHLDGISLRSALAAAGGAIPMPRALHVVRQIADAVGDAHATGIVHRDLKPENVMLVRRGDEADFAKVLDFGVARMQEVEATIATQAGVIFGTARYVSPEGAKGLAVGPPADVYSIAVILFQCLSGRVPFEAESPVAILVKHVSEAPPDVRSIDRSSYVPEPIAALITRNLSKDPAQRCQNAGELAAALMEAAKESGLALDGPAPLALSSGRALALVSVQPTKALELSNELARELAKGAPPSPPSGSDAPSGNPRPPDSARPADEVEPEAERVSPPPVFGVPRWAVVLACVLLGAALAVALGHCFGASGHAGVEAGPRDAFPKAAAHPRA